jgi:hypothetical protein
VNAKARSFVEEQSLDDIYAELLDALVYIGVKLGVRDPDYEALCWAVQRLQDKVPRRNVN